MMYFKHSSTCSAVKPCALSQSARRSSSRVFMLSMFTSPFWSPLSAVRWALAVWPSLGPNDSGDFLRRQYPQNRSHGPPKGDLGIIFAQNSVAVFRAKCTDWGDYRGHIYPGYQDTRPGAVNTLGGGRWCRSAGRQARSDATGRRQAIATGRPAPARPSCVRTCEACTGRPAQRRQSSRPDQRQAIDTDRPQATGSHAHTHTHTRSRHRQAAGHRHSQTNGRPSPAPMHPHTQGPQLLHHTATASPPRPQAKRPHAKQHARPR